MSTHDHNMTKEELFNFLTSEASHPFSGWDLSHITRTDRIVEAPLTWNYASKILPRLSKAESLLDMGTGGGELLSLLQPLPARTCATEGYQPNLPIARRRLEPWGVSVYEISDENDLPFGDEQFELIINRGESYSPNEVFRVLTADGEFITQQVGGRNDVELNRLLGAEHDPTWQHWNLAYAVQELEQAGFRVIEQKEGFSITRFFDAGAIVYYLKAVPWQVPDFSVEKYFDALASIHDRIQAEGYLDVTCHRFFLIAQKG